MPYSLKELQNNAYYQDLAETDRMLYENTINDQRTRTLISGSTADSNPETLRTADGIFISYEDPETGLSKQGIWQEVFISPLTLKVRADDQLDIILKREFKEL